MGGVKGTFSPNLIWVYLHCFYNCNMNKTKLLWYCCQRHVPERRWLLLSGLEVLIQCGGGSCTDAFWDFLYFLSPVCSFVIWCLGFPKWDRRGTSTVFSVLPICDFSLRGIKVKKLILISVIKGHHLLAPRIHEKVPLSSLPWEAKYRLMAESTDLGVRPPKFKSQLCHFLAECCHLPNSPVPSFPIY